MLTSFMEIQSTRAVIDCTRYSLRHLAHSEPKVWFIQTTGRRFGRYQSRGSCYISLWPVQRKIQGQENYEGLWHSKFVRGRRFCHGWQRIWLRRKWFTNGVSLNIPRFLRNKDHFALEEEKKTRIASIRIHVERAIARIKNFRILKTIFSITMAADMKKVWVLYSYLSNFCHLWL